MEKPDLNVNLLTRHLSVGDVWWCCGLDTATNNETFAVDRRRARHRANTEEVGLVMLLAETITTDTITATPRTHGQDAWHRAIPTEFPRPVWPIFCRQASSVDRPIHNTAFIQCAYFSSLDACIEVYVYATVIAIKWRILKWQLN